MNYMILLWCLLLQRHLKLWALALLHCIWLKFLQNIKEKKFYPNIEHQKKFWSLADIKLADFDGHEQIPGTILHVNEDLRVRQGFGVTVEENGGNRDIGVW